MNIGQRIKQRRIELGMSAEKLGELLGKNRSTIYRYENGDIENMPLDVLEPIAEALHTTPAYLMGWDQAEIDAVSKEQEESFKVLSETEAKILHNQKILKEELGEMYFTDDELKKLIDYAKYLIHSRNQ